MKMESSKQLVQAVKSMVNLGILDSNLSIVKGMEQELKNNNEKEFNLYQKVFGCYKENNNEYRCVSYQVHTYKGGRVHLTDWTQDPTATSIATFSMMNEGGLGSSKYIGNAEQLNEVANSINNTSWLTEEEKQFMLKAVREIMAKIEPETKEDVLKLNSDTPKKVVPVRINKTLGNLNRLYNNLDNALGSLHNAMEDMANMKLPRTMRDKIDRLSVDIISSLKQEVELMIEEKEDQVKEEFRKSSFHKKEGK